MKTNSKLFLFLIVFILIISFSIYSVEAFTWNRPTIIAATLNVNHSETSNSTDFWDNLNDPTDINHALLDNLEWSVAGHTMDANLDMNDFNIVEIDKAYFGAGAFISSDDSDHIDFHADSMDFHGNISTIWNIILTDSDGGAHNNNLMFGGQHDAWIYYNASDLIIDPDVVGTVDVVILGDLRSGNINGVNISNLSETYVPYAGATGDVDLGIYNITANIISGQPLDGSIGSGILNASSLKINCGCINVSDEGGLNVKYPDMKVKIWNYGQNTYCDISGTTVAVPDDAHTVYYIDSACSVQTATWDNYFDQDINPPNYVRIFDVYTNNGEIGILKGGSVIGVTMRKSKFNQINCKGGGHLSVCDGMDITKGIFPEINMSAGHFKYINSVSTTVHKDSNPDELHVICNSDGSHTEETEIDIDKCDNGASCDACPDNKYRRYIIGNVGLGAHTEIHQLAPTDEDTFNNLADCINVEKYPLSYTIPSNLDGVFVPLAFYCGRRDDTAWANGFVDLRISGGGFGALPDLSGFMTYEEWSDNANANDKNLTGLDWLFANKINATEIKTETLNVTGPSYLGDLIIDADNITVNNILNKSNDNVKIWSNLNVDGDANVTQDGFIGDSLTVNANKLTQEGLILKGGPGKGGYIEWVHANTTGAPPPDPVQDIIKGYLFVNTNGQLVWSTIKQPIAAFIGNAYVDFATGDARFGDDVIVIDDLDVGGDVDIDGHVSIADASLSATSVLALADTFNAQTGTPRGIDNKINYAITGGAGSFEGYYDAIFTQATYSGGPQYSTGRMNAIVARTVLSGGATGELNKSYAGEFITSQSGGGPNVLEYGGVLIRADNSAQTPGKVTNYYGLRITDVFPIATNVYSLFTGDGNIVLGNGSDINVTIHGKLNVTETLNAGDLDIEGEINIAGSDGPPAGGDAPDVLTVIGGQGGGDSDGGDIRLVAGVGGPFYSFYGGDGGDIFLMPGIGNVPIVGIAGNNGSVFIGNSTNGFDVKFFGGSSNKHFLWDVSEDELNISVGLLDLTGDMHTSGNILVGKDISVLDDVIVSDDLDVGGNLDVSGITTFDSSLEISQIMGNWFIKNPTNDKNLNFQVNDGGATKTITWDGANDKFIHSAGVFNFDDELKVGGVSSDGTGKVVCIKSDGNLGTCSDQPDGSGECTCG